MVLNNVTKFHKILIKTIQLRNHVLKVATIKGKNVAPWEHILSFKSSPFANRK